MRRLVMTFAEALFRVLFTYDCVGEEKIPAEGGVVVAANHPSYLDPVLLSLPVARPIRFMAWEALFRVPLLGPVIRAFGAFPVDVRRGRGREAYARARELVAAGEVVGIFPEGKRSRTGWMEASLREGAARLATQSIPQPSLATVRWQCREMSRGRETHERQRVCHAGGNLSQDQGAFTSYNGKPYPWTTTHPRNYMPYASD